MCRRLSGCPAIHVAAVRETEQNEKSRQVKNDYRNRIQRIIAFWKNEYPEYYDIGVREITMAEFGNPDIYWYKNKEDIVYTGLNVQFFKYFLAKKKKKLTGKYTSYDDLHRYHDAIMWGARQVGERLPLQYYEEITEKFLPAYKKEYATGKSEGNVDESEADAISWDLFLLILHWFIEKEWNVFGWVFSILQWGHMARSNNIGLLGLHNFSVGQDYITSKYDKSKADQTGEKCHEKHLYDNPFQPIASTFLSLGVWLSLENSHFEDTELLFQKYSNEPNAASQRYCKQLTELFKNTVKPL